VRERPNIEPRQRGKTGKGGGTNSNEKSLGWEKMEKRVLPTKESGNLGKRGEK